MTPLYGFLLHNLQPNDPNKACKVKIKAPQFIIKNEKLYKREYIIPWLRCVIELEGVDIIKEAHKGETWAHKGQGP